MLRACTQRADRLNVVYIGSCDIIWRDWGDYRSVCHGVTFAEDGSILPSEPLKTRIVSVRL